MQNILIISPDISVKGGISTVLKNFLPYLNAEEYRITTVSSHCDGPRLLKLLIAFYGLSKILYLVIINKYDIVHIHGSDIVSSKRKYYFFRLVKLFCSKTIYHFHGASFLEQYPYASARWQSRIKYLFEQVNLVICLSNSWKSAIETIAPEAAIKVVPNAVSIPEVHRWERTSSQLTILFMGLIGERKGIFDLLVVFKLLIQRHPDIILRIGGNGEVKKLLKEIQTLGIQKNVRYMGWINDKKKDKLLRMTDIFVLPSYGEGMPMSVLEAMSYGIPVVSTTIGGIPELVVDGISGFLIKPGDSSALYEKLDQMITNQELRKDFGYRGRQIVERNHDINSIAKKIVKIFKAL